MYIINLTMQQPGYNQKGAKALPGHDPVRPMPESPHTWTVRIPGDAAHRRPWQATLPPGSADGRWRKRRKKICQFELHKRAGFLASALPSTLTHQDPWIPLWIKVSFFFLSIFPRNSCVGGWVCLKAREIRIRLVRFFFSTKTYIQCIFVSHPCF